MTAHEIISRLFNAKGVTVVRIAKAHALADRSGVSWQAVLAAMTDAQRDEVAGAK